MSEIIRDASIIAGEINAIKQGVRDTAIRGAIEIGKRLIEAKSMVPYGSWGKWLQENVDYSERTAQDLMRIANEYGKRETQALAEIQNTTQAVLLLALDGNEREQFVQEHDMASMSTRDLEIELHKLREENAKKQLTIDEMIGQLNDMAMQRDVEAEEPAEEHSAELEEAQKKAEELEKKLKEAQETQKRLQADAEKARKMAETAAQAREKAIKASDQMKKQLDGKLEELAKMETDLQEAREKVQTVEVVPEAVEQELKRLREQAARSACESEVRAAYDTYKAGFDRLMDKLEKAQAEDAETADKYRNVFYKATLTMAERMKKQ